MVGITEEQLPLLLIQALKDPSVLESIRVAVATDHDHVADLVAAKTGSKLRSLEEAVIARDERIAELEKKVELLVTKSYHNLDSMSKVNSYCMRMLRADKNNKDDKGEQLKGKKRTKKTEDQSELEVEPRRTPETDQNLKLLSGENADRGGAKKKKKHADLGMFLVDEFM
ncbi:hypothetical protein CAPTEDRAFT_214391 [Capitella teleta]|uniref:Uncharacterized protein n=1 Tax=Capitella teleta TaxID=283909 RepID=R7TGG2_CAPTE|nr:hypothetical protein CAPTEDRAFT_214391 [Capitella teleta]|eukprot:ELT92789.1 hypothetical protein CAPTEDRAFT_214391 [Capitella teleta]